MVPHHAPLGNMVTMPPPLVPNHDEDGGFLDEKNISGQLGLVHLDSTQQPIKEHILT
jgi:hypothetical protein